MIFIGLRWNSASFFSSQQHSCVHDTILSDEYITTINSAVVELLGNNFSADEIIYQLQQQFPILKKIVIAYQPKNIRVTLSAYKPLCSINNVCALTTQQDIFPKNIFSPEIIEQVPHIMVMQDDVKNVTEFISRLLETLPSDIFSAYNIELLHEHCVRLTDKQQQKFTIISSAIQEKLPHLVSQCSAIKHIIAERKDFDKATKWVADTRFAHYIVTYKA